MDMLDENTPPQLVKKYLMEEISLLCLKKYKSKATSLIEIAWGPNHPILSIYNGDVNTIEIQAPDTIDEMRDFSTMFRLAVSMGHAEITRYFLETFRENRKAWDSMRFNMARGYSHNVRRDYVSSGVTNVAVCSGSLETLSVLLEHGFPVDRFTKKNVTTKEIARLLGDYSGRGNDLAMVNALRTGDIVRINRLSGVKIHGFSYNALKRIIHKVDVESLKTDDQSINLLIETEKMLRVMQVKSLKFDPTHQRLGDFYLVRP